MRRIRASRLHGGQAGAAAVELALILPVLVLLFVGMVEFGRAYNAQISLTAAAREGARVMAVTNDDATARSATTAAAPALNPALSDGQITVTPTSCSAGQTVQLTATYPLTFATPMFGTSITLTGRGVMRCGG